MALPAYVINVIALTLAVAVAAAIVLLVSHFMPELAELVPPALSGSY